MNNVIRGTNKMAAIAELLEDLILEIRPDPDQYNAIKKAVVKWANNNLITLSCEDWMSHRAMLSQSEIFPDLEERRKKELLRGFSEQKPFREFVEFEDFQEGTKIKASITVFGRRREHE